MHRERLEDLGWFSLNKRSIQGESVNICYWKRAGLPGGDVVTWKIVV